MISLFLPRLLLCILVLRLFLDSTELLVLVQVVNTGCCQRFRVDDEQVRGVFSLFIACKLDTAGDNRGLVDDGNFIVGNDMLRVEIDGVLLRKLK
ncbi:MAG TPA: hypothetical protein VL087_01220 [Nitrospirota bacterium]|nr:hypothetical protein [Nitrospirota bacterium]